MDFDTVVHKGSCWFCFPWKHRWVSPFDWWVSTTP